MRSALFIIPLALLAACATPQEQCISDATRELRVINRLVNETERNLTRGYALETVQEVRVHQTTCRGENEDGSEFTFECEETRTFDRQRRVAIDLNAEQAKLNSLRQRQSQMQRQADSGVAQCRSAYPE
jgi:hypothetical protein